MLNRSESSLDECAFTHQSMNSLSIWFYILQFHCPICTLLGIIRQKIIAISDGCAAFLAPQLARRITTEYDQQLENGIGVCEGIPITLNLGIDLINSTYYNRSVRQNYTNGHKLSEDALGIRFNVFRNKKSTAEES